MDRSKQIRSLIEKVQLSTNTSSHSKSSLSWPDNFRVGSFGLRSRKLRSALSALGITIGIAALVGVLGLSASGSADLIEDLDALGTNLLTVESGEGFGTGQVNLPEDAPLMVSRIKPVYEVSTVSKIPGSVYRNDMISDGRTRGINGD